MKRYFLPFITASITLLFMALLVAAMLFGQLRPSSQIAYVGSGVHDMRRLILEDLSNNVRIDLAEYPSMSNTPLLWSPDGQWLAGWHFSLVTPFLHVMNISNFEEYRIPMTAVYQFAFGTPVALAWSPDSTRLVFADYASLNSSPMKMLDVRSGDIVLLGSDIFPQSTLAWPEGDSFIWRHITTQAGGNAILAELGPHDASLVWMNPDEGLWQELDVEPACTGFIPFPAVAPDGKSFVCPVFPIDNDANRVDLFLYELSQPGTYSARRLTAEQGRAEFVSWSPDGRTLAFHARRGQNTDIYLLDIETGTQTRITTQTRQDTNPAWSPDGRNIVYTAYERSGNRDLFVYDLDSQTRRQLTTHPAIEDNARWSIDGQWILFTSNRLPDNRGDRLYVMPATGGKARLLEEAVPVSLGQPIESVAAWRP